MHLRIPIQLKFLLGLIILGVLSAPALSQLTLQVGGGLGILIPRADYGGSTIDYYQGTKYGLSSGVNLHGKVRVGFVGPTLVGEVGYASLSNSGNSEPGQGRVEISQKVVSLKAGPEFQIDIPAAPITPYFGAHAAIHRFSGETFFQGVAKVPSGYTYVLQSASRIGIGVNAGAIVKIGPLLSLDFGLHYDLMNPVGRSFEDVNPLNDRRLDSYLALNDDRDPAFLPNEDEHFISGPRSIQSVVITVSVLFGI